MEMAIHYAKRSYGTGGNAPNYDISFRETRLMFTTRSGDNIPELEYKAAVQIRFTFPDPSCGRGEDWGGDQIPAEVRGADLELTLDAARELANEILIFLEQTRKLGTPANAHLSIRE